jgi:hypothetical protein
MGVSVGLDTGVGGGDVPVGGGGTSVDVGACVKGRDVGVRVGESSVGLGGASVSAGAGELAPQALATSTTAERQRSLTKKLIFIVRL